MTYQPPDWVPETEWREFVRMRKAIRHPLTEYACELIVSDLAKFKAQGYEPGAVLRESIKNSWRGVFIPTGGSQKVATVSTVAGPRPEEYGARVRPEYLEKVRRRE